MSALHFDAATHTYTVDGVVLPSVTTILKAVGILDYSGIPQEVLQKAARRGKEVHRIIWLHDEGRLDESTVPSEYEPYLSGHKRFLRETGFIPTATETQDYEPTYGYAGTYDARGVLGDGRLALVDYKTGKIFPGHALQLAAYHYLPSVGCEPLRERLVVRYPGDGTYQLQPKEFAPAKRLKEDFRYFLQAREMYRWKAKEPGFTPETEEED